MKPKQTHKKLSKETVAEIRTSFWEENKTQKELSKLFSLNRNTITNLLLNKTHKDPTYFVDRENYFEHSKTINSKRINDNPPSNARFSKDEVLLIYRLWGQGMSVSQIDKELDTGVVPTVWRVVYGKTYKYLYKLYFKQLAEEPRERRMDRIVQEIKNRRKE